MVLVMVVGVGTVFGGSEPAVGLSDAEIAIRFQARRQEVVADSVAGIVEGDTTKGGHYNVAACLMTDQKREAAQARLAEILKAKPGGDMFWMFPMVSVMMAGDRNLDAANRAKIDEQWRTYWPSRGDTENHWVLYYSSLYLASQRHPDAGRDQWFNGESSAENMAEAKSYLLHWMEITTAHGQGEYDSPNYLEEYAVGLGLLAGWAHDAELRQRARMMLDYIFYDFAVETLDGFYGGAHSRVYPKQIVVPEATPSKALAWFLWGFGERRPNGVMQVLALSGYTPPPILERIARDRANPYVERELKRTRWRLRNAGPGSFLIDDRRTVPVYKYSYVDRDFILGSSQGGLLQPIQQQTWSLVWRPEHPDHPDPTASNTFFGVQPYSSGFEGTMYFAGDWDTLTNLIIRSKTDYDTPDKLPSGSPYEQVFQQGSALVALYDIASGTRFPHVTMFFSRDLTHVEEDASGWIFAQGGPAYIAYRPFAAGEWKLSDWTDYMKTKGKLAAPDFDQWGLGHRVYVSGALKNGYAIQVAPARNFASFDAFKSAVRSLALKFSVANVPEATFTALDGSVIHARYGGVPEVNGRQVDFSRWPLFESPFGHATRGSHQLEIAHDRERLKLDFSRGARIESSEGAHP